MPRPEGHELDGQRRGIRLERRVDQRVDQQRSADYRRDTPEPDPSDLLHCGLERDCLLSEHFFMEEPGMPSECAAQQVRSNTPGVLIVSPYFVPVCSNWTRLLVLRGDGTVIVQEGMAHREQCEYDPGPLVAAPQQSCELDLSDDFAGLEKWFPAVKNCVEGEFLTCAEALELVGE